MKRKLLSKLIFLPRSFRLWWGGMFLYMLGNWGEEFDNDLVLYTELKLWVDTKGKPNNQK